MSLMRRCRLRMVIPIRLRLRCRIRVVLIFQMPLWTVQALVSPPRATGTTRWTNRRIPIPCNPPSLSRPASKPLATDSNMSTTTGRW